MCRVFNEIERIGVAGLGQMGAGIATRLLDAGFAVFGWNRTRSKAEPLIDAGMTWADSPRELAASTDAVITMMTSAEAIQAAAEGPDGILAGLQAGAIWADASTIAPYTSMAIANTVAAAGARFLDCPVSGSPATLAAGALSIMVGGEREAFDRIEPMLRAIGPKVTYIGPNGHAILTKVAINLALVASVTAFAEGIALIEKAGVDRAAAVDAALKSVIASPVIGYRAPLLVDDTAVFADVVLQQKDLVLAQDLARRLGMAVPVCAATSEMLSAARSSPSANRDFIISVHEAYRRLGGMT